MVMGSCLSLQFGAAIATHLFPHAGAWGTTTVRLAFAALILLPLARPQIGQWSRDTWRSVIGFGLALGAMNSFFYASLEHIPLGIAVTIEFLGPLLLAAFLSRSASDLIWVGVAFSGVALLGKDALLATGTLSLTGVILALIAGGFWICYILASSTVGVKVPGLSGLTVAMLFGSLVPLPLCFQGAQTLVSNPNLLLFALGTALLGSVVPYALEMGALRRMPRGVFGVLLSLEPAFAAVAGWLLLSQTLRAEQWFAIALVIAASMGTTIGSRRANRRPTDDAAPAVPA
ncbi:Threonine/homoserine exporter RhtA [Corynebacterium lowii]|uniref:Threonine/homoserine exporter RhtA n=2 Tax=Corynebacterium lowii TaxID=1544413 RepID=A0A0Q0UCZ4_9CORY|nr:Threonine/homoserine exporter RhtA [Corynebacterium lowii]